MNIALVIFRADPARGGAERYTIDLAAALAGRGQRVTMASSTFARIPTGVEQVPLSASAPTRLGRYTRFLDALDGHLSAHRYDVVHAMLPVRRCDVYHPHAGVAAEAVAAGHLKHDSAVLRVLSRTANALNRKRNKFALVERQLLSGANRPIVLCLSEYIKQNLRRHYPDLPTDRLATLFNATDLHKFDPAARPGAGAEVRRRLGIADDKVVALIIAQDFARKGLREAVLATARVRDPRLVLVVVGKGKTDAYRDLARREGVADRVIFAGPTSDPYAFYRAADLFVLPTRHDPCSLVVLEALAMGVPVVSTRFNGACEIMTDGQHGSVLPDPHDVDAVAAALRRLLDDTDRKESAAACLALRPALAYSRHLDELLAIYERVRIG